MPLFCQTFLKKYQKKSTKFKTRSRKSKYDRSPTDIGTVRVAVVFGGQTDGCRCCAAAAAAAAAAPIWPIVGPKSFASNALSIV